MIQSINPFNNKTINEYNYSTSIEIEGILLSSKIAFKSWKYTSIPERLILLKNVSLLLEENKQKYAELITTEMGKPIRQSVNEIDKCIWLCNFYHKNAEQFLADELIETEASESFVSYDPLGTILGIMPWNYPFWQALRFAIPTIIAGNAIILKHAENVTGCALAIQELFDKARFPLGCYQTVIIRHKDVEQLIKNDIVQGVSFTGSENAGKKVGLLAAKYLKKVVLELGGNNACIILDDADIEKYIKTIVNARMQNAGQSCIAAKRFIVEKGIYKKFLEKLRDQISKITSGDPMLNETEMGPLAQKKFTSRIQKQVIKSVLKGAKISTGNKRKNAFYAPTIVTNVKPGMPLFDEEVFGPIAVIIKAKSPQEAFNLANNSKYGLGTMLFTENIDMARKSIGLVEDGAFFINEMVQSDPRLPFGGTKNSGHGRELSREGIREFVNKKTVYIK